MQIHETNPNKSSLVQAPENKRLHPVYKVHAANKIHYFLIVLNSKVLNILKPYLGI